MRTVIKNFLFEYYIARLNGKTLQVLIKNWRLSKTT